MLQSGLAAGPRHRPDAEQAPSGSERTMPMVSQLVPSKIADLRVRFAEELDENA